MPAPLGWTSFWYASDSYRMSLRFADLADAHHFIEQASEGPAGSKATVAILRERRSAGTASSKFSRQNQRWQDSAAPLGKANAEAVTDDEQADHQLRIDGETACVAVEPGARRRRVRPRIHRHRHHGVLQSLSGGTAAFGQRRWGAQMTDSGRSEPVV